MHTLASMYTIIVRCSVQLKLFLLLLLLLLLVLVLLLQLLQQEDWLHAAA